VIGALLLVLLQGAQDVPTPDEIHGYVDRMLIELAEGKVGLINSVTQLDEDQGVAFWNLYQEYEIELYRLGDRRLALQEEFRAALREARLTDELADDIVARYLVFTKDRTALIERYHGLFSEQLSPITAAQFVQLESRFNVVIDLLISTDTPLINAPLPTEGAVLRAAGELALEPGELDATVVGTERRFHPALAPCLLLALYFAGAIVHDMRSKRSPHAVLQWGLLFVVAVAACALLV